MSTPEASNPTERLAPRLLAPALFLLASVAWQFSFPQVIGSDGFFHIRAAERVLGGGMPWMPLTLFGEGWVDHQLLFHVLLAPLAWTLPPVVAAKLGAALLAGTALGGLYLWLRGLGVRQAALFTALAPALSWKWLIRAEMPRVQSLSLLLMLGVSWALLHRRRRLLFALSFLFAWTYHFSLVVVPMALLLAALRWRREGARALIPAAVGAGGLLAGLGIHPHSPRTFRFVWQHVVLKVLNRSDLPVGREWTEGGAGALLHSGWGALLLLGFVAVALVRSRRRSEEALFTALLAGGATLAIVLAPRFVEYAVPLAAAAAGLAARDAGLLVPRRHFALGAATVLLAGGALLQGHQARSAVQHTEPDPYRLAPAMAWLSDHAAPGERIYHFSWNDFPELVLHGPQFTYIVGLDPHFLALQDPELWSLYDRIAHGGGRNPSNPIAQRFGCGWAVLVLPYPGAEELLDADAGLRRAWSDDNAVVYEVLDDTAEDGGAP